MSNNSFPNRRHFLKTTAAATAATTMATGLILPQTGGIVTAQVQVSAGQATKSIKGSETEKNLLKAFAGESQARNRYIFFADQARKENLEQIAAIFEETAHHEQEHARRFFSFLEGGPLEITATYPAGKVGTTQENLEASAAGEHEEWSVLYPGFAKIAEEEGYKDVAVLFKLIAAIEKKHHERYAILHKNVAEHKVFKKDGKVFWKCIKCGFITENIEAPETCPTCKHDRTHFEITTENY